MKFKNALIKAKWYPCMMINKMIFKIRRISVGKGFKSYGLLFIRGTGKISIGDDVLINSCRETNPIGGDTKTVLFVKGNGNINIGSRCGISNSIIVSQESITIEDDVYIGSSCKIYDNNFHSIYYYERINSPNLGIKSAPVLIKKGAFIGAHSIILKGVEIGEKSVVGAGSVVTKSIPEGEIWAGNPAKFIRKIGEQNESIMD